jgi:hypothetical protein
MSSHAALNDKHMEVSQSTNIIPSFIGDEGKHIAFNSANHNMNVSQIHPSSAVSYQQEQIPYGYFTTQPDVGTGYSTNRQDYQYQHQNTIHMSLWVGPEQANSYPKGISYIDVQRDPGLNHDQQQQTTRGYWAMPLNPVRQPASVQGDIIESGSLQHLVPNLSYPAEIDPFPSSTSWKHSRVVATNLGRVRQNCKVCGRLVARDIARHMRTHDEVARFQCIYPRSHCLHRSGNFNRQYDFKKHLLHTHFLLLDHNVKRINSLGEKMKHEGVCPCGRRMKAEEWLAHILTKDATGRYICPDLGARWDAVLN